MNKCAGGIYKIVNLKTNEFYIGSTTHFDYRLVSHFRDLRKCKHSNMYLQTAFIKYGEANFTFKIVEIVYEDERLFEIEKFYIDNLKPHYNISLKPGVWRPRKSLKFRYYSKYKKKVSRSQRLKDYIENCRKSRSITQLENS